MLELVIGLGFAGALLAFTFMAGYTIGHRTASEKALHWEYEE